MHLRFVAVALLASAIASASLAGPLNPPGGAPQSTGRFGPRIEINDLNTPGDANSVYKITQAGSYYFGRNLVGQDAKHGIQIEASNVTIDMNGFTLQGVERLGASLDGIRIFSDQANVTIRNGQIADFGGDGIEGNIARQCTIEDVVVTDCGLRGISIDSGASIRRCLAIDNGSFGFEIAEYSRVSECIAEGCSVGFVLDQGSVVTECLASGNTTDGFQTTTYSVVSGCVARGNGQHGFNAISSSAYVDCIASQNGGSGFLLGSGVAERCHARANTGPGFFLSSGSRVRDSSSLNGLSDGIEVFSNNCWIDRCRVSGNADKGIELAPSEFTVVTRCFSSGNGGLAYDNEAGNFVAEILVAPGLNFVSINPWANFEE